MAADKPVPLEPATTATGLMELMMLHESVSPLKPGWDSDQALTAMRYMRQVIEHRTRIPKLFGRPGTPPGLSAEYAIMTVRSQYLDFALAPDFPHKFIKDVEAIVAISNDPNDRRYQPCRAQVENAYRAATEAAPPANLIVHDLYYWATAGSPGPAGRNPKVAQHFHLYTTIQGNDFYTQDNVPVK